MKYSDFDEFDALFENIIHLIVEKKKNLCFSAKYRYLSANS